MKKVNMTVYSADGKQVFNVKASSRREARKLKKAPMEMSK